MWFSKITEATKSVVSWGKEVASDNNGIGSTSRMVALVVAFSACGVLIAHVWIHHGLPEPNQMYGLSAIIAAGCGAYATGKLGGPR